MIKGKILKDNDDMSKAGLKGGMTIMLMGTAEGGELKAPEKQIKFLEDMTPTERATAMHEKVGMTIPAGLTNLGNTCYMNRLNEFVEYRPPRDAACGVAKFF